MQELLSQIQAIAQKGLTEADCLSLSEQASILDLVRLYSSDMTFSPSDQLNIQRVIEIFLNEPKIFFEFFFEPGNRKKAVEVLSSSEELILDLITNALLKHRQIILEIFSNSLADGNTKTLDEYLDVLFFLLSGEFTGQFAGVLRFFKWLAGLSFAGPVFSRPVVCQRLAELISKEKSSVLKMRAFELIIEICHSPSVENILEQNAIIKKSISLYFESEDDVLEKLNFVELLKRFCYSKAALRSIQELGLLELFKKEAFEESTDIYLKRDLLVILCQFLRSFLLKYDQNFLRLIFEQTKTWILSPTENRNAGFEVAFPLFNLEEALAWLLESKPLIGVLVHTENLKEHHIVKSLQLRASIITEDKTVLREVMVRPILQSEIKRLLALFYSPEHLNSQEIDKKDFSAAVESLLKNCEVPFDDIEILHLKIFEKLLQVDSIPEILVGLKSLEAFLFYLKFKGAKGQQVLQLKAELLQKVKAMVAGLNAQSAEEEQRISRAIEIITSKGPNVEFNIVNESAQ